LTSGRLAIEAVTLCNATEQRLGVRVFQRASSCLEKAAQDHSRGG
jgi:hypothetical protein